MTVRYRWLYRHAGI